MKAIFLIAQQTYREIIRDRILWAFFASAFLLILFSLALGQLTFTEQVKITTDLGLSMIHFLSLALSIFLGVTLVGKELRNRTVYSILARPISRMEYLLGKFFGLMSLIFVSGVILGITLVLMLLIMKYQPGQVEHIPITQSLLIAILAIFFEMSVVASFAVFMSLFTSVFIACFTTFGWWISGAFSPDLLYFVTKSKIVAYKFFGKTLYYLLPRLDIFQIRNRVVYETVIPTQEIFLFMGYAITLTVLLLLISAFIFKLKEL